MLTEEQLIKPSNEYIVTKPTRFVNRVSVRMLGQFLLADVLLQDLMVNVARGGIEK